MKLPIIRSDDLVQLQTKWANILEPALSLPLLSGLILKNVKLSTGQNTIPHKLGRNLQGWFIVRQRAAAAVYDEQDTNQLPGLNLVLHSSAAVEVDILVF